MPSNVTEVPGSQGPRQSGSVIVATDVPTHTSTISFGSHLWRFAGGGLVLDLSSLYNTEFDSPLDNSEPLVDVEEEEAQDDDPVADDAPDVNAFSKLDGGVADCSCDFKTLFADPLLLPLELEMVLLLLELLLLPLPPLLLPLDEVECWRFDNCELFAAAAEEICDDECIMIGTTGLFCSQCYKRMFATRKEKKYYICSKMYLALFKSSTFNIRMFGIRIFTEKKPKRR